ncbi:protein DYAD-like [Silene latifolia]|uniref:protein DYAD-like n=1 Tax=Silene latifolia TaxID=37657 RepID=UPI003D7817EC
MKSERLRRASVLGVVGDAAQNSPLPTNFLIFPKPHLSDRIEAGFFYEINHANLPIDAPALLFSLRLVMVTAKNHQNVTLRYPTIRSLQAFFARTDLLAIRSTLYPATDEKYVIHTNLAVQLLGRQISSRQFVEHRHSQSFWLIKCFQTQPLGFPPSPNAADSDANKNGTCFSMLRRTGINWGSRHIQLVQSCLGKQQPDDADEALSDLLHGDDKDITVEGDQMNQLQVNLQEILQSKVKDIVQYSRKRKCVRPVRSQYKNIKHNFKRKPLEIIPKLEARKGDRVDRWSAVRYETAMKELVEVLKANKAFYGNPISRAALRTEARKRIGDTGLLDHLLKHLAGKVVPSGGKERLRRRCDVSGKMEYWLESADLVNIRMEAGVKDPYWTPPPGWKPGDCITSHTCICCKQVRPLKDELNNLTRILTELKSTDEKLQASTVVLPEIAPCSARFNNANVNVKSSKDLYDHLFKKKSVMEAQLYQMSKALMELEKDMMKLSSKRNPVKVTYSRRLRGEETKRSSTVDLPEETSEESSESDDDEDFEREQQVRKILRPIRLRACRRPNNNTTTFHAVTPPTTSPHSTTTS